MKTGMTLRRRLLRIYWAMEGLIVPGLEYSQLEYERLLLQWIPVGAQWLDLGCGRRLLPEWRAESEVVLRERSGMMVGIDLDMGSLHDNKTAHHKVFGPAQQLPFESGTFDVVTANMVAEHLEDPVGSFQEVRRVLKPNGIFVVHTPNAAAYPTSLTRRLPDSVKKGAARLLDGRREADVFHTYYRANTVDDIAAVARTSGLSVADLKFVSSTAVFSIAPPLAFFELLYFRRLRAEGNKERRSNLIAVLKPNPG
jgi:ubiquinone/menaquinone biosynthesis C-methylase UbiE